MNYHDELLEVKQENRMRRARYQRNFKLFCILCTFLALIAIAAMFYPHGYPAGPYGGGGGGALQSAAMYQAGCPWWCQAGITWLLDKAADWMGGQVNNNYPQGPTGGGGGGGVECAPDDFGPGCRSVL